MNPIRNILVPLDGSALAESAVPVATALARRLGATVHLTTVHMPLPVTTVVEAPALEADLDHTLRVDAAGYLAVTADAIAADGAIAVTSEVEDADGTVANSLVDHVRNARIDLVVMTTHGRGGLERLWVGSVAERFLRVSPVPVLVLHSDPTADTFRRVLVALDLEPGTGTVWETGLAIGAAQAGAVYSLIHVLQPIGALAESMVAGEAIEGVDEDRIAAAANTLAGVAQAMRAQGATVTTDVPTGRGIARRIVQVAAEMDADLIVCGTHGATGLERILLRSVAGKVLRDTRKPLLIVPVRTAR